MNAESFLAENAGKGKAGASCNGTLTSNSTAELSEVELKHDASFLAAIEVFPVPEKT